uniref:Uncharacterized protein n=1 Tax=Echeneis naucrates TaxID=173247 RepID=A0A665T0M7_ECHNA
IEMFFFFPLKILDKNANYIDRDLIYEKVILPLSLHLPGVLYLLEHNEEYVFTLPCAYARSILTVPWVELGGKVIINCAKSGYSANVTFHTKPFYGGKVHRWVSPEKLQLHSVDETCLSLTLSTDPRLEPGGDGANTKGKAHVKLCITCDSISVLHSIFKHQ